MSSDTHGAIDAVWRIESPRLIAGLVRMVRDVGLAEDLAHDALVAALEQWPSAGVPENPAGWLMTTAKRRGIDHFRRADNLRRKMADLERAGGGQEVEMPDLDAQVDYIEDDGSSWEREPLERLAADGELMAFRHDGFWQRMDTLRDVRLLESLWESGDVPWKVWE